MNTKFSAVFDKTGSAGGKYYHFVINEKNTVINGGIYVLKGIVPPSEITILLPPIPVSPVISTIESEEDENEET